jgi:hypothetical protein
MSTDEAPPVDHGIFRSIGDDVTNLHMYWKIYRQLYAYSDQRVALLNETGPLVFYVLQHLLLDEVTLAICRLTDPAFTGKKENHTLERLTAEVRDEQLSRTLREMMTTIQESAKPFRDRRNRAISHSDLNTKLGVTTNPLPGVSREMVENTLTRIRGLLNAYDHHYFKNTRLYEDVLLPLGADGDFLSEQLRRAVAFRDLEREKKLDRKLWTEGRYKGA